MRQLGPRVQTAPSIAPIAATTNGAARDQSTHAHPSPRPKYARAAPPRLENAGRSARPASTLFEKVASGARAKPVHFSSSVDRPECARTDLRLGWAGQRPECPLLRPKYARAASSRPEYARTRATRVRTQGPATGLSRAATGVPTAAIAVRARTGGHSSGSVTHSQREETRRTNNSATSHSKVR